ncbi:MAG: oxidoreductase [Candidatus Binatia bacterium]
MPWSQHDVPDQTGRIAIVTGANSGIGLETARVLARKGAHVVLACRNKAKGEAACADVLQGAPHAKVEFQPLDLSSLQSVKTFAEGFTATHQQLDLLINNAGIMMLPSLGRTVEGFELQFGTNHLGHFALTGRLLSLLLQTANSRVVTVSSVMHRYGPLHFDNLGAEKSYSPTKAYGYSKLANLLFMRELHRRCRQASSSTRSVAAHPGSTRTNLQQYKPSFRWMMSFPFTAQEPPAGALPTLYAATAEYVTEGDYYGPQGWFEMTGPPAKAYMSTHARSEESAKKLWELSEKLTGVTYTI